MKRFFSIFAILILISSSVFAKKKKAKAEIPPQLEIPLCSANNSTEKKQDRRDTHQIIAHTGYTLCYRDKYEQAEWVAYTLNAVKLQKVASRKNNFREDPDVKNFSAQLEDYKKSGFDRGHLAPAADMAYSEITMSESFYLSNMSPQTHAFNAGIWLRLEEFVRTLAAENETVYVVTGPLLEKDDYQTIGVNRVAVPEFFYKALLIENDGKFKMLAFIIPNSGSKETIWDFQCTVREIEERTGIDFFWQLDDELENLLESTKEVW